MVWILSILALIFLYVVMIVVDVLGFIFATPLVVVGVIIVIKAWRELNR